MIESVLLYIGATVVPGVAAYVVARGAHRLFRPAPRPASASRPRERRRP